MAPAGWFILLALALLQFCSSFSEEIQAGKTPIKTSTKISTLTCSGKTPCLKQSPATTRRTSTIKTTPTTTVPPSRSDVCPSFECEVDEILSKQCPLKDFIGRFCKTEDGIFARKGPIVLFFDQLENDYLEPPVTWAEAAEECCLRNMSMAAFDDDDVIETFRMINFNTGTIIPAFWLAGSNKSGQFWWCPSKSKPTAMNLQEEEGKPAGSGPNFCTRFTHFGGYEQKMVDCEKLYKTICTRRLEFPELCFESSCANEDKIELESRRALIRAYGIPVSPESGAVTSFTCTKEYFTIFSSFEKEASYIKCCDFGLQLVDVSTKKEMDCIVKNLKNFTSSFWTSAVLQITSTESFYGFCPTGNKIGEEMWAKEHPLFTYKQSCVSLHVEQDEPDLTGLTQAPCELELPIICQFP